MVCRNSREAELVVYTHDGIRLVREWNADIVMSHCPNDYNPANKAFAAVNVTETSSKVDRFRDLRWEGGTFVGRPKHWVKE